MRGISPIEYQNLADNKEYHLNVHLTLKKAENWADAGHIVAEEQFALHTPVMATETITPQGGEPLKVTDESRQRVNIFNNNIELTFNKLTAQLISMQFSGNEMLHMQQGPRFYGIALSAMRYVSGLSQNSRLRTSLIRHSQMAVYSFTPSLLQRLVRPPFPTLSTTLSHQADAFW